MSISSISNGLSWSQPSQASVQTRQNVPKGSSQSSAAAPQDGAVKQFMDYMNESPAQRMQDTWLAQHGITKAQFDAMSPADKEKILAKIKQEVEAHIKQKTNESLTRSGTTIPL